MIVSHPLGEESPLSSAAPPIVSVGLPTGVERAMIIAAHPDDIEAFVGGTVATLTREGVEVTYVIATHGEAGVGDPGVPTWEVRETRAAEQEQAAEMLGVQRVVWLGGPTETVVHDGEVTDTLELRLSLVRLIRVHRPDLVVTFDPLCFVDGTYLNHPDHRAVGAAAVAAIWPSAANPRYHEELLGEGLEPHVVLELWLMLTRAGSHAVDIGACVDLKARALAAHATQLGDPVAVHRRVLYAAASAGGSGAPDLAERFERVRSNATGEDPLALPAGELDAVTTVNEQPVAAGPRP
ncbi:hypothetical protein BH24ACT5_BH24ACT5_04940 [soil metagenome]